MTHEQTPYLVIVAVVAVIAVVTLVMNNNDNLQGALTYRAPENERVKGCIDTDENGDIYTRGYTQIGVVRTEDECRGNMLHQWYCKTVTDDVESTPRPCEFGCENGACLRQRTYG